MNIEEELNAELPGNFEFKIDGISSLCDEDENYEQETLDEKVEDMSFTFNDGSKDFIPLSGSTKGLQTGEVCHKKRRNLSFLWQQPKKTSVEIPKVENQFPQQAGLVAPGSYQATRQLPKALSNQVMGFIAIILNAKTFLGSSVEPRY